jgi:LmbE family N-acetylglucosaminyl deacetylase
MNILLISSHTDDWELGCGGTVTRLVAEGNRATSLTFSYTNKAILKDESKSAMEIMGVTDYVILDYETRNFLKYRQDILQVLYDYNKNNNFDLVMVPARYDLHQDHQVVTQEAMRAFRGCTMLGYELPWNNIELKTNYFVRLQPSQVDKKIAAIRCYDSQREKRYFNEEFLRGLLKVRGIQIQAQYAEAFETIRIVQ